MARTIYGSVFKLGNSPLQQASVNVAGVGDNILVAAVASKTIYVYKIFLEFADAVTAKFKSGAGTDLTGPLSKSAGGSMVLDYDGEPWFETVAGEAFVLNLSAAIQSSGRIYYQVE